MSYRELGWEWSANQRYRARPPDVIKRADIRLFREPGLRIN